MRNNDIQGIDCGNNAWDNRFRCRWRWDY
jgi:hypothetical protein